MAICTLPDECGWQFYLVDNEELYLRAPNDWIPISSGGSTPPTMDYEGISLNDKTIGGIKFVIEEEDVLKIPEYWQYNVRNSLTLLGTIYNNGIISIE